MKRSVTVYGAQSNILMKLGDYKFMLLNSVFQEFVRTTEYKWGTQHRIGLAPSSQFLGEGSDVITLPGVIFPEWLGGMGQVEKFRAMGSKGIAQLMVTGHGKILGYWFIERIEEKQSNFALMGSFRKQEYTLTIRKQAVI